MPEFPASPAFGWSYTLEDSMGLVFVLGVITAYSLKFAFTRPRGLAWLSLGLLAVIAMGLLLLGSGTPADGGNRRTVRAQEASPPAPSSADCGRKDYSPSI